MLPLTQQIFEQAFVSMVSRIQENIRSKRVTKYGAMNASGKTAASVTYELTSKGGKLWGAGYIFSLEFGRGPTSGGGSGGGGLQARIRQWIDDKNIEPKPGTNGKPISKDSLAYLIKRKIHNQGTLLYQQGGNSGILKDAVNEDTIKKLTDAAFYEFETIVTSKLLEAA